MIECTVSMRCSKVVNDYDPGISKDNVLEFRIKADKVEELKDCTIEFVKTTLKDFDLIINNTDLDTKKELSAVKEVYGR